MSDAFTIIAPVVRAEGKDVPPEEIQRALNSIVQQMNVALNNPQPPSGAAGGDLSGTYPNPTVAAVHATSGTMSGATITGSTLNSTPVGQSSPNTGAFTTLTATTPVGVTSGGTGRNALNANAVVIGEGSSVVNFASPTATTGVPLVSAGAAVDPAFGTASVAGGGTGRTTLTLNNVLIGEGTNAVNFAAPGAAGQILASNGAADPTFQTKTALAIASSGANSDITSLSGLTTALSVAQGGTGRQTLTTRSVLIGEGTAAVNFAVPSTAGQALVSAGAAADPVFGFPTGTLVNVQVFTAGGTYTPTSGAVTAIVEAIGGGGGGGGAAATAAGTVAPAQGGFSGSYAKVRLTSLSSQTVTIGAAGAGGAAGNNAGTAGGQTTFGAIITCPGGLGGSGASAQTPPFFFASTGNNAAATTTATALILSQGESGFMGIAMVTGATDIWGGAGGPSPFGGGAGGTGPNAAGTAATSKGTGGGGATSTAAGGAQAGGNGAAGVVVIYEYA